MYMTCNIHFAGATIKQASGCKYSSCVGIGVAPAGLAQVHGDLVLLVAQAPVCMLFHQILHNLYMASHSSPMQRRVLPLQ